MSRKFEVAYPHAAENEGSQREVQPSNDHPPVCCLRSKAHTVEVNIAAAAAYSALLPSGGAMSPNSVIPMRARSMLHIPPSWPGLNGESSEHSVVTVNEEAHNMFSDSAYTKSLTVLPQTSEKIGLAARTHSQVGVKL